MIGKVALSVQADQNYHTKVTGTVWCIENMTIFPFAIKHFLCYVILLFLEYVRLPISGQPVIDGGFRFCFLRHYTSLNIPMRLPPLTHLYMHQLLQCPHTMTGSLPIIHLLYTKGALCTCEVNPKTHFITRNGNRDWVQGH